MDDDRTELTAVLSGQEAIRTVRALPVDDDRASAGNEDAEAAVLGTILLSEQVLAVIIDGGLERDDFSSERHRRIFAAMARLADRHEPIDAHTVSEELDRDGALEEAGSRAYVHSLPNLVPAAANVRKYARIVKEHALMRRLVKESRRLFLAIAALSRTSRTVPRRRGRREGGSRPTRRRGSRRGSSSSRGDPDSDSDEPARGRPQLFIVDERYGRISPSLARFIRERGL